MDFQRIEEAYRRLDRSIFLEEPYRSEADYDAPLPIGFGQTASQPTLVLHMTELLDPGPDTKVLEIGTGSGYQTALLAAVSGTVVTVERFAELSERAERRLSGLGIRNVRFRIGDGSDGAPEEAPFDRIMVTAAASRIPDTLVDQLSVGGRMVIPVGLSGYQELLVVEKRTTDRIDVRNEGGVVFVEFVGRYGFGRGPA